MNLKARCPHCKTPIEYGPEQAGQSVICSGCQETVRMPSPKSGGTPMPSPMQPPTAASGTVPLPPSGPKAVPTIPKTTISNTPVLPPVAPVAKTTIAALPPLPARTSSSSVPPPIEPVRTTVRPAPESFEDFPPENQSFSKPKKNNTGMMIGLSVIAVAVVAVTIGLVAMFVGQDNAKPTDNKVVKGDPKIQEPPRKDEEKNPPVKSIEPKIPEMNVDFVRQSVVRSSAWVVADGQQISATGMLIDATNQLVLTSYHMFKQSINVRVYFPLYDADGNLTDDPKAYLKTNGYAGRIIKKAESADLALIQLDNAAIGVPAIRPEPTGAPNRDHWVMAIRAIGPVAEGDGKLWQGIRTKVSKIDPKRRGELLGQLIEIRSIEIDDDASRDNGDNGGPVVNAKGLLVGIASGLKPNQNGGATHTDFKEAIDKLGLGGRGGNQPGKEDLPRLMAALSKDDVKVRLEAVRDLGNMGVDAKGVHYARPAVPALMGLWSTSDVALATEIATSLNQIGRPEAKDIDVLQEALKGNRREGKLYALHCLKQMGEEDGPKRRGQSNGKALPQLLSVCGDKEFDIRAAALITIPHVASAEKEGVVRVLLNALKDEQQRVRLSALDSLGKIGRPVRDKILESLIATIGDKDDLVAASALATLEKVHPLNDPDVPAEKRNGLRPVGETDMDIIRQSLKHEVARVRRFVASELYHLGRKALPAMPELKDTIEDADAEVRMASLRVLQVLGQEAAEATPGLIKVLKDADVRVRAVAALTLGAVGSQPGIYPALLERLTDKEFDVRRASGKALQDIKKPVPQDVAEVIALLKNDEALVRRFAAVGLGALGKAAKDAWPALVDIATKDKSLEVRIAAISALGEGESDVRTHAASLATALRQKVEPSKEDKQLVEQLAAAPDTGEGINPEDKTLLHRAMLLSTVWVMAQRGFGGKVASTGYIVDVKSRLLVTSAKITGGFAGQDVLLYPPELPKGASLDEVRPGQPGVGRVIAVDRDRDIALIALRGLLPPQARAFTFAANIPKAGESVSALGTSGADQNGIGRQFSYSTAKVDRVLEVPLGDLRGRFGRKDEAPRKCVELDAALYPGDAGGPVVNSNLELVGMKVKMDKGRGALLLDASEVRDFVRANAAVLVIPVSLRVAGDKNGMSGDDNADKTNARLSQKFYRITLLEGLKKIGLDESETSMTAVVELLGDTDPKVREKALSVVSSLGPKLRSAWKAIFLLLGQESTQKEAEDLLLQMGPTLAKDLYQHMEKLPMQNEREMFAVIHILAKLKSKEYLNRIANRAPRIERDYPPKIKNAARVAYNML